MNDCSAFWNALAQFHDEIEDTNFDRASVRCLLPEIDCPVLVVGAGQGLIVEELRKSGHECDGLDLSSEMVRQAKLRRGITLVEGDAKAMPFPAASYATVIYATGVMDFTADEDDIRVMLREGRRVVKKSGRVFVAFYKASPVHEEFLERVGLIRGAQLAFRDSLEIHLLNPAQMVDWMAARAGLGRFRATLALLRVGMHSSRQERKNALTMRRLIHKFPNPRTLINAAPETAPYRNEREIRNLFQRLGVPIAQLRVLASCCVARIEP